MSPNARAQGVKCGRDTSKPLTFYAGETFSARVEWSFARGMIPRHRVTPEGY